MMILRLQLKQLKWKANLEAAIQTSEEKLTYNFQAKIDQTKSLGEETIKNVEA